MRSIESFLFLLIHLMRFSNGAEDKAASGAEVLEEEVWAGRVSLLVTLLIEQHYSGCHIVLLTTAPHSPTVCAIQSQLSEGTTVASVSVGHETLQKALAGEYTKVCQVLVLHITDNNDNATAKALRLLDQAGLWKMPETVVVVVGGQMQVTDALLHPSLRNTIHGLYLALHHSATTDAPGTLRLLPAGSSKEPTSQRVSVFRRCMFCSGGQVQFLQQLDLDHLCFKEHFRNSALHSAMSESLMNMHGHTFQLTTIHFFPYVTYSRDTPERGTTVTLMDSLNVRILRTLASALNFTYVVRENPERSFGNINTSGQYSGLMGELQQEEADFCLLLGPSASRFKVIDYLRLEPTDYYVIISKKPSPLPAVTSFIRPFSSELWGGVLVGLLVWSATMLGLQGLWHMSVGGLGVSVPDTLLYGWGALLTQSSALSVVNFAGSSGQMLAGWWLVACLIIATGYKSSLVAHLTVQAKTQVPESFKDLVEFDRWRWGIEEWMLDGLPLNYLKYTTDPVVQEVYRRIEVFSFDELLQNILVEKFAMISTENYIRVILLSRYVDKYGQMPFQVEVEERQILACFGWGMRKGAPFLSAFTGIASRLEDAGFIKYWSEEVVAKKVKENRATTPPIGTKLLGTQEDQSRVVLSLDHLQGAFYLLLFGCVLALVTLLAEITP